MGCTFGVGVCRFPTVLRKIPEILLRRLQCCFQGCSFQLSLGGLCQVLPISRSPARREQRRLFIGG